MGDNLSDPQFWAGVRDWVIGLGTLGTLAVSVVVLRRQGRELEAQDAGRRAESEYQRSAQARLVRISNLGPGGGSGINGQYTVLQPSFEVSNDSDEAVHDVALTLTVVGNVAPDENSNWAVKEVSLLERRSAFQRRILVRALWNDEIKDYEPFHVQPKLTFTDMAGQRWERDHEHRLEFRGRASQSAPVID